MTGVVGLGFKDQSLHVNRLDANRNDDAALLQTWPVLGVYMPDTIAALKIGPNTYLATANEGDAREYDGLGAAHDDDGEEPVRLEDIVLDPTSFPPAIAAILQDDDNGPGDLNVSSLSGDTDGDGDYDVLNSFGARSFSLERIGGGVVHDMSDPTVHPDDDGPDAAGDLAPESARVVRAEDSPNGQALLLVTNEVSGTLGVYRIAKK